MDSAGWTLGGTFAAHLAFVIVDVSHIVFNRNGLKSAYFGTFSAANASGGAGFACYAAFVFVDARYKQTAVFFAAVA